jgi:AraC-like DNA-binding protein
VLGPDAEAKSHARVIAADNGALRFLSSYVQLLEAQSPAPLQRLAVAHVHDLVKLMLGTGEEVVELAGASGVRAARLRTIKQDIIRNLDRNDVSIGALAKRHQLTARYIQMLFESEGGTLTDFVLAQRLARAHRRLCDPRRAAEKISAVAFDCGFGDLSYFNRAFRARFGATPSEVRAQARRTS